MRESASPEASALDDFSGGRRSADEAAQVRRRLNHGSDRGSLSRRLNGQAGDAPSLRRSRAACDNSFTAGTLVQTDAGLTPIEEIETGDKVFAEDPETGDDERGYFEVVAVTNHPTDELIEVTLDVEADGDDNEDHQLNSDANEDEPLAAADDDDSRDSAPPTMQITPEHPVYVEGKGWLWAENLAIGDTLRRADGGMAKVLAIDRLDLEEPQRVYNFTVKGPHSHFVLEVGLLHLRTRWYAPGTGTFLSRDPVESEPPYQYVRGNVVNLVDPSGTQCLDCPPEPGATGTPDPSVDTPVPGPAPPPIRQGPNTTTIIL